MTAARCGSRATTSSTPRAGFSAATRPSWQQRGYDDGYFGNNPQDLRLAQECARFGVQIAQSEYLAGWRDGHDEWDRLIGSYGQD